MTSAKKTDKNKKRKSKKHSRIPKKFLGNIKSFEEFALYYKNRNVAQKSLKAKKSNSSIKKDVDGRIYKTINPSSICVEQKSSLNILSEQAYLDFYLNNANDCPIERACPYKKLDEEEVCNVCFSITYCRCNLN